jgi:topoisomerase-4 subunit A
VAQLCESITKANDAGKIKIKKMTEFTGRNVEIQIDLAPGISSDITIDALYAFTDCEVSISPNACIIEDHKPKFVGVQELLKISVDRTKALLQRELEIKLSELEDKWHYTSLEKIFLKRKFTRN